MTEMKTQPRSEWIEPSIYGQCWPRLQDHAIEINFGDPYQAGYRYSVDVPFLMSFFSVARPNAIRRLLMWCVLGATWTPIKH